MPAINFQPRFVDLIVRGDKTCTIRKVRKNPIKVGDACQKSGTKFFFKQWGAYGADGVKRAKKANGREWQGRTWDEMPVMKG